MAIERNLDEGSLTPTDEEFAAIAAASAATVNPVKAADAIFRENAPLAASEIVGLALSAANERVRLDASKYVVERVMGRTPDAASVNKDDGGAPWDGIYGAIVVKEPSAKQREAGAPVTRAAPQSNK